MNGASWPAVRTIDLRDEATGTTRTVPVTGRRTIETIPAGTYMLYPHSNLVVQALGYSSHDDCYLIDFLDGTGLHGAAWPGDEFNVLAMAPDPADQERGGRS